jgi:hypothetical protein
MVVSGCIDPLASCEKKGVQRDVLIVSGLGSIM